LWTHLSKKSSKDVEEKKHTVKFSTCLSPEVKEALEDDSYRKFGKRKGAVSMNLEHILRLHYSLRTPGVKEI
jgi:hypothetical protein